MNKGFSTPILYIPSLLIILFALLIYVIFILLTSSGSKSIDPIDLQKIDVNNNLLNFLSSQVMLNDKPVTVSNLINLWYYDRSNAKLLDDYIKKVFSKVYGSCYYFTISENDRNIFTNGIFVRKAKDIGELDFGRTITLPVFDRDLEIYLDPSTYYIIKDHKVCGLNE